MEQIKQGKLTILKGDNFATITKSGVDLSKSNEDLWTFVDALIGKGYELTTLNNQGYVIFTTLTKKTN